MVVRKRFKSIRRSRHDVVQPGAQSFRDTDGALWIQEIELRDSDQRKPMGFLERQTRRLASFFNCPTKPGNLHKSQSGREQYTIKSTAKPKSWRKRVYEGLDFETPEYNPSVASMKYVNWTFTVSSTILFLHILFFYLLFTFFFALLLLWAGTAYPKCVIVDGNPLSESPHALADSFALSWTTFSTVGYGMTYGGISSQQPDHGRCTSVIMILTTEALVGLLYSGMCAAILFGKVNRVQSHAPVIFSHALCIMYSDVGVNKEDDDTLEKLKEIHDQNEQMENFENEVVTEVKKLEYKRNLSHTVFQSEPTPDVSEEKESKKPLQRESIKTSPFSAPVSRESIKTSPFSAPVSRESIKTSPFSAPVSNPTSTPNPTSILKEESKFTLLDKVPENPTPTTRRPSASLPASGFELKKKEKNTQFADMVKEHSVQSSMDSNDSTEQNSYPSLVFQIINQLANNPYTEILDAHLKVVAVKRSANGTSKIYANVSLNESEHPFFQRVWHAMHTLNEYSTLLTVDARKAIAENGGWPPEWNSSEIVRQKLSFSDLIATISGISNISGSQVIKHKRFSITDLLVGYEFAPLLYREEDKVTKVDMSLVHDVVIQRGISSDQASSPGSISNESIRLALPAGSIDQDDNEEFGDNMTMTGYNGISH